MMVNKFMCPCCGKETIPVMRRDSKKRPKGHRKWLYCPWCNKTVNTYEIRDEEELQEFRAAFESGEITKKYQEELDTLPPQHLHV